MKKIILIALLLCVYVFNVPAQANITKEEAVIYAQILKTMSPENWKENKTKFSFLILENTFKPEHCNEYQNRKMKGLLADFKRKNQTTAKLPNLLAINYKYELINKAKIDELLEIGKKDFERIEEENKLRKIKIISGSEIVWRPFYKKYPDSAGYYQFSRAGFSLNKRFAMVCVERNTGVGGDLITYILRKVKGKWRVYFSTGNGWVE